ncbi:hypothetical protein AAIP46_003290 [Yersinia ruckeri]|uniref:hypothetical protein n=1 Tax=Yersinia ruckeri TaxID=29486 RepID=UPI0011A69500|nr:hypothetical protein [Yersinia ruckeri]
MKHILLLIIFISFPLLAGPVDIGAARSAAGIWGLGCNYGNSYLKRLLNGEDRAEAMALELHNLDEKIKSTISFYEKGSSIDKDEKAFILGLSSKYSIDGFKSKVHDAPINCEASSRVVEIKILRSLLGDVEAKSELANWDYYKYQ